MTTRPPHDTRSPAALRERLREWVSERPDVLALYLFGSAQDGTTHAGSDVDVAVLLFDGDQLSAQRLWVMRAELSEAVHADVDLLDLQAASTVMRMQVVAYGERVVCRDEPLCEELETRAYSMYARLNEERQAILDDVRRRGSVYGDR